MILRILITSAIISSSAAPEWMAMPPPHGVRRRPPACLTGTMTDVQSWLHWNGTIMYNKGIDEEVLDLSYHDNPVPALRQLLNCRRSRASVKYLSLAACGLTYVPMVFDFKDGNKSLSSTLQYLSFYGNFFSDYGPAGQRYDVYMNATSAREETIDKDMESASTLWDKGFKGTRFSRLRQLDLRSCSIHYLGTNVLEGMPKLTALYLSGNNIHHISGRAFQQLPSLLHLDLSRNAYFDENNIALPISWGSVDVFEPLRKLESLDLSFTSVTETGVPIISNLGPRLRRLSLCYTGIKMLKDEIFINTSLKFLDLSGNYGIFNDNCPLQGLENSLEVVYADNVGLRSLKPFKNFTNLRVLKISNNELPNIKPEEASSLNNLQILDLDFNRISSWFVSTFSLFQNLKMLSLKHNNINIIKSEIIEDLQNITYLGISENSFVCSCYARELFEIARKNEHKNKYRPKHYFKIENNDFTTRVSTFHNGYRDYSKKVDDRNIVTAGEDQQSYSTNKCQNNTLVDGNFVLFDYELEQYQCVMADDGAVQSFANVSCCKLEKNGDIYQEYIYNGWKKIVWIVVVGCATVASFLIGFIFRRKFRYFLITLKNSALLSSIEQPAGYEDGSIFHYDVFVSYCNEDRSWVLDQLLPHVEKDCNISVCLHERDFQVGLSILENIVSCIDRSRSILLVLSQRFLLSQWCQFEMHLAQHRLLETRREDLILVLLEDIPRRVRPNTLHYLMISKTYVLWPKNESEQDIFWKRLKKCLIMQKIKSTDNVSLA